MFDLISAEHSTPTTAVEAPVVTIQEPPPFPSEPAAAAPAKAKPAPENKGDFMDSWRTGDNAPAKEAKEAPAEEPAAPAAEAAAATEETPPAKVEEAKPAAKKAPRKARGYDDLPISAEALEKTATAAANAAANAVAERFKPTPEADEAPLKLRKDEQHQLDVLQHMEKMFPESADAKGTAERARQFLKTTAAWEAKHPGEVFDIESAEGVALRKRFKMEWDEEQYAQAEEDLKIAPMRERLERTEREMETLRREREIEKLLPKLQNATATAVNSMAEKLTPELAGVLNSQGQLDDAKFKKFEEQEPELAATYRQGIEATQAFVTGINAAFNNLPTPLLDDVAKFCTKLEADIMALPASQRFDGAGRQFIPRREFVALPPTQRANFFALTPETVTAAVIDNNSRVIQQQAEIEKQRIEKYITARGYTKNGHATAAPAKAAPTTPAPPRATKQVASPGSPMAVPSATIRSNGGDSEFFSSWKNGSARM